MEIRSIATLIVLTGCATLPVSASAQQDYPNKPIRVISNLAAGATPDIMMRALGPTFQAMLGQPIIMDNKTGASGRIAFEFVAKAPADGYTILVSNQNLATATAFMKDLSFDPVSDLPPISIVASTQLMYAANTQQPYKTFPDMVTYAKANPGKVFQGHGGVQTTQNLFMLAINQKYGTQLTGVPYKGGSPQMWLAAYQNETQLSFFTETAVTTNIARVTPIAVTGDRRLTTYPNVPTFNELGLPQVIGVEYIVHVPRGTPQAIIDKLRAAINAGVQKQEVKDAFSKTGLTAVGSTAALAAQRHAEYTRFFTEMGKTFNIQPE
jgi:tripartite-type tricarboxylate transporter receptor subunit TctC